ncbi:UNVERIFIED_CONTAM: hypothetical protein GTU68_054806 [Idotea baltica]|nr:hypothetical protein [Idotea baltica]
MISIIPKNTPTAEVHQYLLGAVAPRPICWASTVDKDGNLNVAPYSFFNVFSSNPPIAIFSSNRKVSDNTTKDTLKNIEETMEVVINVVPHSLVKQMALTSISYPPDVNEFEKAGLTPIASDLIKPFRIAESPVQLECVVTEIKPLGDKGGAGNLIFCEIVKIHINEAILDEDKKIDPNKIDLMGRMGRAFYTRAKGDAVMKIFQPVNEIAIGFDNLPEHIRNSSLLSKNEITAMASITEVPSSAINDVAKTLLENVSLSPKKALKMAKSCIQQGDNKMAYAILDLLGDVEY